MEFEILAEANAVPKSAFPVIIWSSRNYVNTCHVIFQKLGEKFVIQKAENGTDHWSFFFLFPYNVCCAYAYSIESDRPSHPGSDLHLSLVAKGNPGIILVLPKLNAAQS